MEIKVDTVDSGSGKASDTGSGPHRNHPEDVCIDGKTNGEQR